MSRPVTARARDNVHAAAMHLLRTILRQTPLTQRSRRAAAHVMQARALILEDLDDVDEIDRLLSKRKPRD